MNWRKTLRLLSCIVVAECFSCSDDAEYAEISAPRNNYFIKRFSRFIAVNAGSFKDLNGHWQGRYRIGSFRLQLDTNGRFTYCNSTCIGSYLTYGTWMRKGSCVLLDGDSGNAYSASVKPVVLNTDANIFHDTTLVYFDHKQLDLRNDTLFATDTTRPVCRLYKYIPYDWDNPYTTAK